MSEFFFNAVDEDLHCKYGGVSFFDLKDNEMHETTSRCTCRTEDQQNVQDYYSDKHKTVVVMYSYVEYSYLSISINLSITYCHIVKINLCAVNLICLGNAELCSTNFKNQPINVQLRKEKFQNLTLMIQSMDKQCSIIQILYNPWYEFPFSNLFEYNSCPCQVQLSIKNLMDSIMYQYHISGYFSSYDILVSKHQEFSFTGLPYKFNVSQDTDINKWWNGSKENILMTKCGFQKMCIIPAKWENVEFKAFLKEIMPSHQSSLKFWISLIKWISWIEFYIIRTNATVDYVDEILINNTVTVIDRAREFEDKILKVSMNSGDLNESTVLAVNIETKVKR